MNRDWKNIPPKLEDCREHGHDSRAELFIVEGNSAAKAVAAVRDPEFQAVLPMQGKPLNAAKANHLTIAQNGLFKFVFEALGLSPPETNIQECRFSRIIMLFDPDADGIHCGALMMIFFYKALLPLLECDKICLVRAPLFRFAIQPSTSPKTHEIRYAYSQEEAWKLMEDLEILKVPMQKLHYRGLASMGSETLEQTCVNPRTRRINRVRPEDAEAAMAVFGGNKH